MVHPAAAAVQPTPQRSAELKSWGSHIRVILRREIVSRVENQAATGSRRHSESLQAALRQLRAQMSDPALAMPTGSVCGGALLKARDAVRLTRDLESTPSGSEGVILGWYANEPEHVIVSLSEGGVEKLPREALELIEIQSAA
jgi:hypothetical protein